MRSISSAVTLCASVVLRVSISGESPLTVTASFTPPTAMTGLTSSVLPSSRFTSGFSAVENPVSSNRTLYRPGSRSSRRYTPSLPLTTVYTLPVCLLVMETVTPGSTAPVSSLTMPVRPPKRSCASERTLVAAMTTASAASASRQRRFETDLYM